MQLTPARLKSWSRCKKQFYYKTVKELEWPSDPANFSLGQDVHKLLDYQARGLDMDLMLSAAAEDVAHCYRKLADHPVAQLPAVASEWGFFVPIKIDGGAAWLSGRIDRIAREQTEDGDRIVVIDWKTGTAAPKHPETDWQTLVYLYAMAEAYPELGLDDLAPEQLSMIYLEADGKPDGGEVREIRIDYSTAKHEATRLSIAQTLAAIRTETVYALPERCPDRFCPYAAICGIEQVETASGSATS